METEIQGHDGHGSMPRPAIILGAAGFLPFLALSLFLTSAPGDPSSLARSMLHGYGAVILSFLGGIHWGRAIATNQVDWSVLSLGVIPSLIGWLSLPLPYETGALMLIAGFLFALACDVAATKSGRMPEWYLRLRIPLTVAVCLAILVPALI